VTSSSVASDAAGGIGSIAQVGPAKYEPAYDRLNEAKAVAA
jgi:hypothetical protein